MTQSSVSYQIAGLEQSLGFKLFRRDSHHVSLTKVGAFLFLDFQRLVSDYEKMLTVANRLNSGLQGEIAVGYSGGIGGNLISSFSRRFIRDHPGISLALHSHNIPTSLQPLLEEKVDIAFTLSLGFETPAGIESAVLFSDRPCVLMRPDSPLASRTSLRVEDLDGLPMVAMSKESGVFTFEWMDAYFARHGTNLNIVKRAKDVTTLMHLVASGVGMAFLARHCVKSHPGNKVHWVDMVTENAGVDFLALWRSGSENPCLPSLLQYLGIQGVGKSPK